jgi:hypothetical protein
MLGDLGVEATFFAEGRTLGRVDASLLDGHEVGAHGFDHEDFSLLDGEGIARALSASARAVEEATGSRPVSFRAPYMKAPPALISMLPGMGFEVDSSEYARISPSMIPSELPGGVARIPVPEGEDESGGRIAAYLWPMHEGRRRPGDYLRLASRMEEGALCIATHTWHMVESRASGRMSPGRAEGNARDVEAVLSGLLDMGFEPMPVRAAAGLWRGPRPSPGKI